MATPKIAMAILVITCILAVITFAIMLVLVIGMAIFLTVNKKKKMAAIDKAVKDNVSETK